MNVICGKAEQILIKNASFFKSAKNCQLTKKSINECQSQSLVFNKLKNLCNNKSNCLVYFDVNEIDTACFNDEKSLNVKYECKIIEIKEESCKINPCGYGAICKNFNGNIECTCPVGVHGDPRIRCCKPLRCGYSKI